MKIKEAELSALLFALDRMIYELGGDKAIEASNTYRNLVSMKKRLIKELKKQAA